MSNMRKPIKIKVACPQEGMSGFRKRGWFPLFAGEAEPIARGSV